MRSNPRHYTAVAIALHWVIAAAILVNLGLGVWMSGAIESPQTQGLAIAGFQWHKSIGLTVLVLSLLRLAWRFLHPPPPLPPGMAGWERAVAGVTHWLFYGLMIGIPLSGWLYVSAQWRGDAPLNIPTLWFGLFEVPHLFGLNETSVELREATASRAVTVHGWLAFGLVALLVLHIASAIGHQFVRRDGVLARMLPWLASPDESVPAARERAGMLAGRLAAASVLTIAVLFTLYATNTAVGPRAPDAEAGMDATLREVVSNGDTRAPAWQVDRAGSDIRFSGVHAGRPFKGHFQTWRAAVRFDAQEPDRSLIAAVVETASATDGVPMHDRTLPQREWFDAASHPYAVFRSKRLTHVEGNRYALTGTLTIKTHEVELAPLTLTVDGDVLRIRGDVELDRADVDMGMESDPQGQYVSRTIGIAVDVTAWRGSP